MDARSFNGPDERDWPSVGDREWPSGDPEKVTLSLCGRVAALFKAYPNQWLDGRQIAQVGGYAAWRTRVSDLRRAPFNMVIENETVRHEGYTVSRYKYVP